MKFTRQSSIYRSRSKQVRWIGAGIVAVGLGFAVGSLHQQTAKPSVLPAATSPESRNAIRRADLNAIGDALQAYVANAGRLPITIPATETEICSASGSSCRGAKLLDLYFLTDGHTALAALPLDPDGGASQYGTGFTIVRDKATGRFKLSAPRAELGAAISVLK